MQIERLVLVDLFSSSLPWIRLPRLFPRTDELPYKGRAASVILALVVVKIFLVIGVFWLDLDLLLSRAPPERRLAKAAYLSHHAIFGIVVVIGVDTI